MHPVMVFFPVFNCTKRTHSCNKDGGINKFHVFFNYSKTERSFYVVKYFLRFVLRCDNRSYMEYSNRDVNGSIFRGFKYREVAASSCCYFLVRDALIHDAVFINCLYFLILNYGMIVL